MRCALVSLSLLLSFGTLPSCSQPTAPAGPSGAPADAPAGAERTESPRSPETDRPPDAAASVPPLAPRFGVSHVLVGHRDAPKGPPGVERTRDEALRRATMVRDRALAGDDLAELARRYSDEPSGGRGGRLGTFAVGVLDPTFEAAVARVAPGGITEVIETPYGLHVARREPIVEARLLHVALGGDPQGSPPAAEHAQRALRRALSTDAPDEPAQEGPPVLDLGIVGPGQLPPDIEAAAFALEPGELSAPLAGPGGWHLIGRLPDQRSQ